MYSVSQFLKKTETNFCTFEYQFCVIQVQNMQWGGGGAITVDPTRK